MGFENFYQCPSCGSKLSAGHEVYTCENCSTRYKKRNQFVDFVQNPTETSTSDFLQTFFEQISPVYQSLYFPILYRLGTLPAGHSINDEIKDLVSRSSVRNGYVLDIACGPGDLTRALAKNNRLTFGLDLSKNMLKTAHQQTTKSMLATLRYIRADMERLPFKNKLFDLVTCSGAFYFFEDLTPTLSQIKRVLKPGGRLAGMIVVEESIFDYKLSKTLLEFYQFFGSYRVYETEEFISLLQESGFSNFSFDIYGCVMLFDCQT